MKKLLQTFTPAVLTKHLNNPQKICHIKIIENTLALEIVDIGSSSYRTSYPINLIYEKIKNMKLLRGTKYTFWIVSDKRYQDILFKYKAIELLPYKIVKEEMKNITKELYHKEKMKKGDYYENFIL